MARKSNEPSAEDVSRQIAAARDELEQIAARRAALGFAEEDAEDDMRKRIRSVDRMRDFWQGSGADRFAIQEADECRETHHQLLRAANNVREDITFETEHLQRRQEALQEDFERLTQKEEQNV